MGNFFTFHFSDATQIIAVKVMNLGEPFYVFATHWHASILKDKHKLFRNGERSEAELEDLMSRIQAGVEWRLSESEKTTAFIEEIAGNSPFVLMGDFNSTAESEEIANLLQFGMVDVFQIANPDASGFTWNPEKNLNVQKYYLAEPEKDSAESGLYEKAKRMHESTPKRIDFIFAGSSSLFDAGKISVKSSRVVMDEIIDGVHASDHFGVFAEIEFK